jgi:hypothetical protein
MRRMAIGTVAGVAIWIGSALAAEAQQITPTGPLSVVAGATSGTYTANIDLPAAQAYMVRVWVYDGPNLIWYSQTINPNPGVTNPVFSKDVSLLPAPLAGDVLTFKAQMRVGLTWYAAPDWVVTVTGTRPSKPSSVKKTSILAPQTVDRDRRRE